MYTNKYAMLHTLARMVIGWYECVVYKKKQSFLVHAAMSRSNTLCPPNTTKGPLAPGTWGRAQQQLLDYFTHPL